MPPRSATTHVIAHHRLIVYRRSRSSIWQCRYKIGNTWQRGTTKETDLALAKERAWTLMREAEFRLQHNLPAISRRFKDVAALAVKRMETELANQQGKVIYTDYLQVIRDYLVPFFGKHHVDKIKYDLLEQYEQWRTQKMGRVPSKSTVHTHNAALGRIFDEAVVKGYLAEIERPKLDVTGRKVDKRPSFDEAEVIALINNFDAWAQRGLTEASREKRLLLRDYVMLLLDTGARPGKELEQLTWQQISTAINPQYIETGKSVANEWGEGEAEVLFEYNRSVWMPVTGKTGTRTIVGFARSYLALDLIAQRNFGQRAEDVIAAKRPEAVLRTKDGVLPTKFEKMFEQYLSEHNLLIDPKTGQKRVLYCLRHTYATLMIEKDAVDVFLLEKQMGTSVEMIRKHYGHIDILRAADHLKAGKARAVFGGVGKINDLYRSKLLNVTPAT